MPCQATGNGFLENRERGLALDHGQIVPPVVDGSGWQMVTALDQAFMLTRDLALGGHDKPFWIDPQADRTVRK